MAMAIRRAALARSALFGMVLFSALPLLYVISAPAALVRVIGLDREFATYIVELLITEGAAFVLSVFPWLEPFIGVLRSLLTFGAQFVIGF